MSKQRHNLAVILSTLHGAAFIGIDTDTIPKLSGGKKNPMLGNVIKRHVGASVMVCQNKFVNGYDAMVKRRLVQEGKDPESFVLGVRPWGTRIPETPIIQHGDTRYLEVIFKHPGDTTYIYQGNVIAASAVQGLATDVEESEQGGLDNKVIIRTVKLESITAIRFNKQEYVGEFYYDESEVAPGAVAPANTELADTFRTVTHLLTTATPADDATALNADQMAVVLESIGKLAELVKTYSKLAPDS